MRSQPYSPTQAEDRVLERRTTLTHEATNTPSRSTEVRMPLSRRSPAPGEQLKLILSEECRPARLLVQPLERGRAAPHIGRPQATAGLSNSPASRPTPSGPLQPSTASWSRPAETTLAPKSLTSARSRNFANSLSYCYQQSLPLEWPQLNKRPLRCIKGLEPRKLWNIVHLTRADN